MPPGAQAFKELILRVDTAGVPTANGAWHHWVPGSILNFSVLTESVKSDGFRSSWGPQNLVGRLRGAAVGES